MTFDQRRELEKSFRHLMRTYLKLVFWQESKKPADMHVFKDLYWVTSFVQRNEQYVKFPLKILFIGSNPAMASASNKAFESDTASGRLLKTWTEGINGTFYYENIVSEKTENNRPLKKSEMANAMTPLRQRINRINPDRIVALGRDAALVLSNLELKFLDMPHPSGRNRKLNDKAYAESKVAELRVWCR